MCLTERMVQRARAGIAYTNFKPVDYGHLKSMIAEKKFTEQESLMKLEKVEAAARRRKDENSLKQHLNVWNRELIRLSALRRQIEVDIETSVYSNLFDNADKPYKELMLYRESLDKDFFDFKKHTCDPIWLLRLVNHLLQE
jgi:predicted metal-dependent phosphotriesterase family hydrolase